MQRFLKEYSDFRRLARKYCRDIQEEQIVNLFAIWQKNNRTKTIIASNSKGSSATEKQLSYIRFLMETTGSSYDKKPIEELTKQEASELIERLKTYKG